MTDRLLRNFSVALLCPILKHGWVYYLRSPKGATAQLPPHLEHTPSSRLLQVVCGGQLESVQVRASFFCWLMVWDSAQVLEVCRGCPWVPAPWSYLATWQCSLSEPAGKITLKDLPDYVKSVSLFKNNFLASVHDIDLHYDISIHVSICMLISMDIKSLSLYPYCILLHTC